MNTTNALLISSSMVHGRSYLDHVEPAIREILTGRHRVLFFPFALHDRHAYAAKAKLRFASLGITLDSIYAVPPSDRQRAIEQAEAFFVGGGNTFRLLYSLYENALMPVLRARILSGVPYIGSSAGAIIAGPTIKTTKDMPILQPPSFTALGIFPYQISPHYQDPDPTSTHMGETQEERIVQFLEENETPVIGLREGSWIRQKDGAAKLGGELTCRIFRRGIPATEVPPQTELEALLGAAA